MILPFHNNLTDAQIENLLSNCEQIIRSGQFILGSFNEALESRVSQICGGRDAVAMSSGTVSLECLFDYFIRFGSLKKIAVQSNTNFATVSSILRSGGDPVFIDCDRDGQICVRDLENKFDEHQFDAVIPVHIGGYITKAMPEIVSFCNGNDLLLFEDCAHAHGSSLGGRPAGTFGTAAIFSFFPTKLVNGGEGGALVSADAGLIDFAKQWRNQGKSGVFGNDHSVLGGSYRMTEINCALAVTSFENLSLEMNRRSALISKLSVDDERFYVVNPGYLDSFSCYKVILRSLNSDGRSIESKLRDFDIICGGAVYRKPCHSQPVFVGVTAGTENLNNTMSFCREHFCIPLHSGMSDEDVERISEALSKIASCV